MGIVYLVGAGPGDAGLITVKGARLLHDCDAVVYDRLASEKLLDFVSPTCCKIYVGKQAGCHSKKQDEINGILVDCAKRYRKVIRLKGGDPFVFGRGGEEIEALERCKIPYQIVPGVTSAVAVPECAGIPVTHRGVSRSFHVITGHTNTVTGEPACNYLALAQSEGTLVFLMGLAHLNEITQGLLRAGKSGSTPSAVISDGTGSRQQVVRAPLAQLAQKTRESGLTSPAVIVVGQTAALDFAYPKADAKTVGITATPALCEKLTACFAAAGLQAVPVCEMRVQPTNQIAQLAAELHRLTKYNWVLFTSQNAVRLFFAEFRKEALDLRCLGGLRFAALGSGTAAKLREYGITADFLPSCYDTETFAREFVQQVPSRQRLLLPHAVQGSLALPQTLRAAGHSCTDLAIYDVAGGLKADAQSLNKLDWLVFVSASGVREFFRQAKTAGLLLPPKVKIACIGRVTQAALRQEQQVAEAVAVPSSAEGLTQAVAAWEAKEAEKTRSVET